MYIAVDAIANEDDSKLSYLMFPYDEDFLDAIEENLKEIRVENEITFSLDDVLLIRGEFHYVRKKVTMTDISEHRYCIARNTEKIPQLQNSKLHVANDYFYFSGYRKPINRHDKANVKFVSENFNLVTIENLRKYVKSKKAMVE
jgi:hypothetical protein